ncbi:Protein of unknown function [Bacillus cereus]|nr:Protein of unknown function [Bacillus cereus]
MSGERTTELAPIKFVSLL